MDISVIQDLESLHGGSTLEGLATTNPAPAPGTLEPSGPMLFSAPCRAMALSVATNEFKSRDLSSPGAAFTFERSERNPTTEEQQKRMMKCGLRGFRND